MALRSHSPDIVDVFTGRYQAMHVPSRDRCIATVLHATISYNIPESEMMCLKVSVVSRTFEMDLILVMLCLFHCFLKFGLSTVIFFFPLSSYIIRLAAEGKLLKHSASELYS
jgi:hypothetical protein